MLRSLKQRILPIHKVKKINAEIFKAQNFTKTQGKED